MPEPGLFVCERNDDEDYSRMIEDDDTSPPPPKSTPALFALVTKDKSSLSSGGIATAPPPFRPHFEPQSASSPELIGLNNFLNVNLELTELDAWLSHRRAAFVAQIFPQFFVPKLVEQSSKFAASDSRLFTAEDEQRFKRECSSFGDLNDPMERDRVYRGQCELLYDMLSGRIKRRPSLLYTLIDALRFGDWYHGIADAFEAELNAWERRQGFDKNVVLPNRAVSSQDTADAAARSNAGARADVFIFPKPSSSKLYNIPTELSYFVARKCKSDEIVSILKRFDKIGKGWLVLHGMGGSGKTVLAASTIREMCQREPNLYTGGIFWLTVGDINASNRNIENHLNLPPQSQQPPSPQADFDNQLLLKMELLADFLRSDDDRSSESAQPTKFEKLDAAIHRLQIDFANRLGRSLLILDDVWCTQVVHHFARLNIPVMITTRERSICGCHLPNVTPVSIAPDERSGGSGGAVILNDEQAIMLLSKCLPKNSLINIVHLQANNYVLKCLELYRGLPYAVPMIANCMEPYYRLAEDADHGTRSRFGSSFYDVNDNDDDDDDDDDDNDNSSVDSGERIPCYRQWRQLYEELSRNRSSADGSMPHLVRRSIESLDERLKQRIFDFVIFFESVPFDVFRTLWQDMPEERHTLDVLIRLVDKSLVIKTTVMHPDKTNSRGGGSDFGAKRRDSNNSSPTANSSFGLHDITLDFLRHHLPKKDIQARHRRLIDAYLERYCRVNGDEHPSGDRCCYDYARLPDDQYIYHNLAYHLYAAGRCDLFAPIFLDLRFAKRKIEQFGHSDLLADYYDFERFFAATDQRKLKNYREFVAANSIELCAPQVDILQLALNQPNDTCVYQDAERLIRNSRDAGIDRIYFAWKNKQNCSLEAPPRVITFKTQSKSSLLECDELAFGTFSPDSNRIATVTGRTLQIWNSATGERCVTIVDAHHQTINHCAYSRNGHYLLTCADDGTAIMWRNESWSAANEVSTRGRSKSSNLLLDYHDRSIHYIDDDCSNERIPESAIVDDRNNEKLSESNTKYFQSVNRERRRRNSGNNSPLSPRRDVHSSSQTSISSSSSPTPLQPSPVSHQNNSSYSASSPRHQHNQNCTFSPYHTFNLRFSKLKSDAVSERNSSPYQTAADSIKCGDISANNRLVLTGNGIGHMHLWSVATEQQVISAISVGDDDDDATRTGKAVECVAFSGDSRFLLGLVSSCVYIYRLVNQNASSSDNLSCENRANARYRVYLCRKLVHQFKAYNAIFHSSGSAHYPTVFTSSGKYIFEWDLDTNQNQTSSFFDFEDNNHNNNDDNDQDDNDCRKISWSKSQRNERQGENRELKLENQKCVTIRNEKRKYWTSVSLQNNATGNCSGHIAYVAISRTGTRLAGFEHTRNEIYLWSRGEPETGLGFGSRSGSAMKRSPCPYSTSLRCQLNIASLCFSYDEERLLGCCRSGKMTIWDIGKDVRKTSIIDLKKNFSVTFGIPSHLKMINDGDQSDTANKAIKYAATDDLTNCPSILTIDTKGFLRLFVGMTGDEDKQFSVNLRRHLHDWQHRQIEPTSAESIMPPIDITSCDISADELVIFGSSCGEVFCYDPKQSLDSMYRFVSTRHHDDRDDFNDSIFDCQFIPNGGGQFVTISKRCISLFDQQRPPQIIRSFRIDKLPFSANASHSHHQPAYEAFQILPPQLSLITFWTTDGRIVIYDYAINDFAFTYTLSGDTKITSVDCSTGLSDDANRSGTIVSPPPPQRHAMICTTADKRIAVFLIQNSDGNRDGEEDPGREHVDRFSIRCGPRLPTQSSIPRCVRIASDMSFLIVGYDDGGLARLRTDAQPLGKLEWINPDAHPDWMISDIQISPDRRIALSASDFVRLWNAADGTLLQSFGTHGIVCRMVAAFPAQIGGNSAAAALSSNRRNRKPRITVVTVTDASILFILQTFNYAREAEKRKGY